MSDKVLWFSQAIDTHYVLTLALGRTAADLIVETSGLLTQAMILATENRCRTIVIDNSLSREGLAFLLQMPNLTILRPKARRASHTEQANFFQGRDAEDALIPFVFEGFEQILDAEGTTKPWTLGG